MKCSAVILKSKFFGVLKKYILRKTRKKYNRHTIKTKLDVISWIETNKKINGRKVTKEELKSYTVGFVITLGLLNQI